MKPDIKSELDPEDREQLAAQEDEIANLESRLAELEARRRGNSAQAPKPTQAAPRRVPTRPIPPPLSSSEGDHHWLLLLSDSALPLGSFAFSSGLESYLQHLRYFPSSPSPTSSSSARRTTTATTPAAAGANGPASFAAFLPLSLSSYASTTLPFVLEAHRRPGRLAELDDALDAATICAVGRRASVAQGRALLSVWDKSFAPACAGAGGGGGGGGRQEEDEEEDEDEDADPLVALRTFTALLRSGASSSSYSSSSSTDQQQHHLPPPVSAHLAPLFGVLTRHLGLTAGQAAYVFLLSHVKALVSAGVRAGLMGPFQSHRILASPVVRGMLPELVAREWDTPVERAGQKGPVVDLWVGRHEILYSKIFNS